MKLPDVARFEMWFFLVGLLLVVGFRLLTGKINTRGLIRDKITGQLSPGRIQLLIMTIGGAAYYGFQIVSQTPPYGFPELPPEVLYLVGGSNAAYLAGKMRLFSRLKSLFAKA